MSSSSSVAVPLFESLRSLAVDPSSPELVSAWTLADVAELRGAPETESDWEAEVEEVDEEALAAELAAALEAAAEAEREAERAREVAEWEARVKAAYDEGFAEGRTEGEIGEQARLRTAVAAAEEVLEELREGEMRWTGTIEENVCALAVIVARQVIGRELAQDVEAVMSLVRMALAEFPVDQPMRIRVNPTDLASISRQSADGADPLLSLTRDRDARWLPDAAIAPGGCVVEGRERIIDGRVDVALERIYRRLTYTNA